MPKIVFCKRCKKRKVNVLDRENETPAGKICLCQTPNLSLVKIGAHRGMSVPSRRVSKEKEDRYRTFFLP